MICGMAAPLATTPLRTFDLIGAGGGEIAHEEPAANAADQILALTSELQERDRLIAMLTERLEQAAEQLDRMHRSGGDRSPRSSGGGVPAAAPSGELLERQLALAERMEAALSAWEGMQSGAMLERIELRLESLVSQIHAGQAGDGAVLAPVVAPPPAAAVPAPAPGNGPEGWEAIRNRLMTSSGEASAPEQPAAVAAVPDVAAELTEAPVPIDPAEQSADAWRAGCYARDTYISYLIGEYRRHRQAQPIDWEAVKQAPETLQESIRTLEQRLTQEVKRENLDLSLERARLAREQAQLDQVRTRLDKEIRRLGVGGQPPAAPAGELAEPATARSRLFGRRK